MKQSVICIAGASGGTGKSTIAKELSIAFGRQMKTCLIDLDLPRGGQNPLFKLIYKKNIMDWVDDYHRTRRELTIDELSKRYSWDFIQRFLIQSGTDRLYILPAPADGLEHDLNLDDLEMILLYLRDYFDLIILDTGNNLEPVSQSAMCCADLVLIVTTADQTTINNTRRLRKFIRQSDWDMDKFQLVVNRQVKHTLYSPQEIEDILYLPVFAILHEETEVWMLNNAGIPVVTGETNSLLKKDFEKLQSKLLR